MLNLLGIPGDLDPVLQEGEIGDLRWNNQNILQLQVMHSSFVEYWLSVAGGPWVKLPLILQ